MRTLLRDRFLALAFALVAIPLAAYALPGGAGTWMRAHWAGAFADPIYLVLAIATLVATRRPVRGIEERNFWRLVLATCVLWLAGNVVAFGRPATDDRSFLVLPRDVLYLASYVTLVLATDLRPHLPAGWARRAQGFPFAVLATLLCVLGTILYFFVLPRFVDAAQTPHRAAMATFLALDVLLTIRFAHLFVRARRTPWAPAYACLTFACATSTLSDSLNQLLAAGRLHLDSGTPFDAIWWMPLIGLLAARRLRDPKAAGNSLELTPGTEEPRTDATELLLVYAFLFPTTHLVLVALGYPPASGPLANELVLIALFAFVILAVVQQRRLEISNTALRSELRVLVTNEQVVQSQKLEGIGRLAGGLAHDFNNLLTVILGRADMLATSLGEGEARRFAEEIGDAAERGAALTHQLLAFSRKQVMQTRSMDLNSSVCEARTVLTRLVGERYTIHADLAERLAPIEADPSQVFQVILNLVTNARDAMPEGGTVSIRTHELTLSPDGPAVVPPRSDGTFAAIDVSDTGAGIDPETQPRIFDPFFSRKVGGTGLGLAVVYGIVTQSGGHLRVDSSKARGTTITALFPYSARAASPAPGPAAPLGARAQSECTILLVEDQAAVRRAVRVMLEHLGYRVIEAADGAHAVELCRSASPNVLLTDVVMPDMRGPEVARAIRAIRPEIPIVYMSGFAESGAGEVMSSDPYVRFIAKPFTAEELGTRLQQALEMSSRKA